MNLEYLAVYGIIFESTWVFGTIGWRGIFKYSEVKLQYCNMYGNEPFNKSDLVWNYFHEHCRLQGDLLETFQQDALPTLFLD